MTPASAKQKGRKLQQYVVARILAVFNMLQPDDVINRSMGAGGEDIILSPLARKYLPISIECKNTEKLNIWAAFEQACENAKYFNPVLIIKRNRSATLAVVDLEFFLALLKFRSNYDNKSNSEVPK